MAGSEVIGRESALPLADIGGAGLIVRRGGGQDGWSEQNPLRQ